MTINPEIDMAAVHAWMSATDRTLAAINRRLETLEPQPEPVLDDPEALRDAAYTLNQLVDADDLKVLTPETLTAGIKQIVTALSAAAPNVIGHGEPS